MRKPLLFFVPVLALFFFLLLSFKSANAQQDAFYQSYLNSQESYRRAENQYELKRSEYLKFGTLASKNEAISATRSFLIARDNVWVNYFSLITSNLRANNLVIKEDIKNTTAEKIEAEVGFFENQKREAENANELEKLVEISRNTEERINDTETVGFTVVGEIKIARLEYQKNRIQDIINDLETKLGAIDDKGDKDTSLARRWLTDAKTELASYQDNIMISREVLLEIETKTSESSKRSKFNEMQSVLDDAKENLYSSNKFLSEIVREVKTAD